MSEIGAGHRRAACMGLFLPADIIVHRAVMAMLSLSLIVHAVGTAILCSIRKLVGVLLGLVCNCA